MSINDIFVCKQAHTHAKLYCTRAAVVYLYRIFISVRASDGLEIRDVFKSCVQCFCNISGFL